jgi:hypothetical protein
MASDILPGKPGMGWDHYQFNSCLRQYFLGKQPESQLIIY